MTVEEQLTELTRRLGAAEEENRRLRADLKQQGIVAAQALELASHHAGEHGDHGQDPFIGDDVAGHNHDSTGVAGSHHLLSSTHTDTTTGTVTRGDIIVGGASTWQELARGITGTLLTNDGSDIAWSGAANADSLIYTNDELFVRGNNGAFLGAYAYASIPILTLARAAGTIASPSLITGASFQLGRIDFDGHTGASFSAGARIGALSTAAWAPGAHGTKLDFYTTGNSSASLTLRMELPSDGGINMPQLSGNPSTPAADTATLFVKDSGAGETRYYYTSDAGTVYGPLGSGSGPTEYYISFGSTLESA